jgi:dephospho-CoA kinase
VVHELLDDPKVRARLLDRWGAEVVAEGAIDRGRVGAIVFDSAEELAWLESLLHPLVGTRITEWYEQLPPDRRLAVVEVPLLFESGMESAFDDVVAVIAPDEARAERAGLRGTDLLESRRERQLSQEEKAARANHVIVNDGTVDQLEQQVAELIQRLTAAPGGGR